MKMSHNRFFSQLTERDIKQLETFAKENQSESIRQFIRDKIKKGTYTAADQADLENLFANAFNSVPLVSGLGTRQYELRHGGTRR